MKVWDLIWGGFKIFLIYKGVWKESLICGIGNGRKGDLDVLLMVSLDNCIDFS